MIAVIADDLSGAAELAGAASLRGLSAEVHTSFAPEATADVICVDTGTRALDPDEAARVIRRVVRDVAATHPDWIYFKFDSVLRGNVREELRAAMDEIGQPRALLVTANPSRGRVVRGGDYFVEGLPLDQTPFALDPDHPRRTASVRELLGGDLSGIETPDVETPQDLVRLAGAAGADTLLAGSAEFFEALLALRMDRRAPTPSDESGMVEVSSRASRRGVTLLTCGSLASWEIRRAEAAERGIGVFDLSVDPEEIIRALSREGAALLGVGGPERTPGEGSGALVERLAERVAQVVGTIGPDRLLLEGGATAAAVLRRLGWTRLTSLPPGGPGVGVLREASREGPILFIKPGSYPWPEGLW